MSQLRISEAAIFLGVSDDTVRRLIDGGTLTADKDGSGRTVIPGAEVAALLRERARLPKTQTGVQSSARNHFTGIVTKVRADQIMAQVELQCGPYRVVSLMSAEAAHELGLEPGSIATAVVKSTNVVIESAEQEKAW
ncbi:TOBE domain-containing protein [Neomicrococcus lactis]|uniref:Molybdopterin-binding protein n=1 Tax=Neomicrococcus lactis TaxID=732241 RepID=A0A7W9DAV2_9MICC|nr:TOBE domain-containing protein [Neomicrococcus lactis]MBB5598040.1 molybdopterin-binding protein [Neomicrococcus lactis]